MNNVFIQIDGFVIVRNFIVQVKQIVHDDFLLIIGNEEGMVLGRRIPVSENVIFECGNDHDQDLGLLIGD